MPARARRRAVAGALAAAITLVPAAQAATPSERLPCTEDNAAGGSAGKALKEPVQLTPDPGSQVKAVNVGADRDGEEVVYTLVTSRPISKDLAGRLSFVGDAIARTEQGAAETVAFPEPRFSKPVLSGSRDRIRFRMCVQPPRDLPAGAYTGVVDVEGPLGVEATAVTLTMNARNGELFWFGLLLTLLLAFGALAYKDMADRRKALVEQGKTPSKEWGPQWSETRADLAFWVTTLAALGTTFGTLYAVYRANASWGEDGLSAVAALVGTGLAAVGARAILTSSPTATKR